MILEGFPSGSEVKNLPVMQDLQETQVQSLGQEDPLEEEIAIHSSTIAWKIPWTEEPSRLVYGVAQSMTRLSDFTFTFPGIVPQSDLNLLMC